jgi:methylenetetrahydrofolate dehydrogenase (NADP+) / methenyltetrahydrofolate cyclohydrolase
MKLLDGKETANKIYESLIPKINYLKNEYNITPNLSVIIIGEKPESLSYVKMKSKKCKELGIDSKIYHMNSNNSTKDVICQINKLNRDSNVHSILVQLPLPNHLNTTKIISSIDPSKDVDGFHAVNMGLLSINQNPNLVPCTPKGCIYLLKKNSIDLKGKNVVIIGKSNIVGMPLALMLMHENATVTVCHIDTVNIKEHTTKADILIIGCGVPEMIKADWIKDGVDIIDIGINFIPDLESRNGKKLVGDVDFERVKDKVNYITPVPGGVGPMTIAMLMQQTVDSIFLNLCKNVPH